MGWSALWYIVFQHSDKKDRMVLGSLGSFSIRKWFCIIPKEIIKSCDHLLFSTLSMTTEPSTLCCLQLFITEPHCCLKLECCFLGMSRGAATAAVQHELWPRQRPGQQWTEIHTFPFSSRALAEGTCHVHGNVSDEAGPLGLGTTDAQAGLWFGVEMSHALWDASQLLGACPSMPGVSTQYSSTYCLKPCTQNLENVSPLLLRLFY